MADKKNNIYIIEGFDEVGKDYYVQNTFSDKEFYRPDHNLFDKFLGRQESWAIGFSIFDFLSRITKTSVEVVINRCITSSLVYSELYNGRLHLHKNLDDLINFYKNNKHFQEANHIHVCHKDMASAREIYKLANKREDNDEYDIFDEFSDYWKNYCNAELLFSKYYKMLGITPTYIYNEYVSVEDKEDKCYQYPDLTKMSSKDLGFCEICDNYSCKDGANE